MNSVSKGNARIMQRALKNSRLDDFWALAAKPKLIPRETREYVPMILAAIVIARNPAQYGFDIVPVALVVFLLWKTARPHLGRLGVDFSNVGRDALWGAALALAIGIPGLLLVYVAAKLGLNAQIVPAALQPVWWAIPVLILSAIENAPIHGTDRFGVFRM